MDTQEEDIDFPLGEGFELDPEFQEGLRQLSMWQEEAMLAAVPGHRQLGAAGLSSFNGSLLGLGESFAGGFGESFAPGHLAQSFNAGVHMEDAPIPADWK